MIDVLGGLLDELEKMHRETEAVVCHTIQAGRRRANLCLRSVKVLH